MPASTIDFYKDPYNKLVVEKDEEITVVFDYPFKNTTRHTYQGPLTAAQLRGSLMSTYADIYDEESRTTTIPVLPEAERGFCINRNSTDGIYGIWGHDLEDLCITGLGVSSDGLYYMSVES